MKTRAAILGWPEQKQARDWRSPRRADRHIPSVYSLKPRFQNGLRPLVGVLANLGITANQVTIFSCAISAGFGLLLIANPHSRGLLLCLPPLLAARMALNAMDGMLAREFGQESNLGAYLNELGDVVSDSFLCLPFIHLAGFDSLWMMAVLLLTIISEMAGTLASMVGATRRYDGPMGKSDRAVVFGAVALWCGLGFSIPGWASYGFPGLMCLLLTVTVINRVRSGLAKGTKGMTNA